MDSEIKEKVEKNCNITNNITITNSNVKIGCCCGCSCNNDGNQEEIKMRVFKNQDELIREIEKLLPLTHEELVIYETSIRFNSFGKLAEQVLLPITNDESFLENLTHEQTVELVNANSEFLFIGRTAETDADGESEEFVDMRHSTTIFRYVMNRDRMFQVEDTLYRIFENGFVTCNVRYFNELVKLTDDDFLNLVDNDIFTVVRHFDTTRGNHGKKKEFEKTSGVEKVKVILECYESDRRMINNQVTVKIAFAVTIKGFRRFIFWWPASRTLSHDISGAVSINNNAYYGSSKWSKTGYTDTGTMRIFNYSGNNNPSYFIHSANGYGKTQHVTYNINLT